jgi:surface protein
MSGIFSGCKSLTSINLSSFNTEKVICLICLIIASN